MKKERKTEFIQIRATKTEVAIIKTAAKLQGVTMSKLIWMAVSEFIKAQPSELKHNRHI